MRSTLMLLLGGGAFLGLVLIFIYNSLVAKRNMVRNAFSSIDVNLRKRHDLIPNLVETVKAYASHEKETFTRLIKHGNKRGVMTSLKRNASASRNRLDRRCSGSSRWPKITRS